MKYIFLLISLFVFSCKNTSPEQREAQNRINASKEQMHLDSELIYFHGLYRTYHHNEDKKKVQDITKSLDSISKITGVPALRFKE